MLTENSVVFIGLARDCGQHLLYVLDNVHLIASLFGSAAFVFAENDSKDATPQTLRVFAEHQSDCHVLNFDGIGTKLPERTRRFAFLRNSCLGLIRADKRLRSCDYLVVMDMDDVNVAPLDEAAVVKAVQFMESKDEIAGVFANCSGIYYDMWTLREPRLCPGDVFEEQLDFVLTHQVDDLAAYKATFEPRLFSLAKNAPPLEVESAFGGLGIYKMKYALRSSYKGEKPKQVVQNGKTYRFRLQVCEHVHFNSDVRQQGGKLYILPFLINRVTEGIEFSETAYRSLVF